MTAALLMQADGERSENRGAVGVVTAVERFFDMFEAGLHRYSMAGQKRALCGSAGKAFQGGKTVRCSKLADRVHPGVEIERREAGARAADFGNAQPDLLADRR
jgi:hypothetical protein